LQSVSFSENAPASLWPLNGISWRPQNSIVLMVWERRFRFSSTAFCRLLLKAVIPNRGGISWVQGRNIHFIVKLPIHC